MRGPRSLEGQSVGSGQDPSRKNVKLGEDGVCLTGEDDDVMGWSVHEAFLERILAQVPSGWWNNSSLTVAFDNFLTKYDTPQNQHPLAVLSTIVRFGVTGLFMWLFMRSRSRVPHGPPRRHLDFLIAVSACLLLMPIVLFSKTLAGLS